MALQWITRTMSISVSISSMDINIVNGREFIQCFLACDEDKGADDKEERVAGL